MVKTACLPQTGGRKLWPRRLQVKKTSLTSNKDTYAWGIKEGGWHGEKLWIHSFPLHLPHWKAALRGSHFPSTPFARFLDRCSACPSPHPWRHKHPVRPSLRNNLHRATKTEGLTPCSISTRWKSKLICISKKVGKHSQLRIWGNPVCNIVPVVLLSYSHRHFQTERAKDSKMGRGLLCGVSSTGRHLHTTGDIHPSPVCEVLYA